MKVGTVRFSKLGRLFQLIIKTDFGKTPKIERQI